MRRKKKDQTGRKFHRNLATFSHFFHKILCRSCIGFFFWSSSDKYSSNENANRYLWKLKLVQKFSFLFFEGPISQMEVNTQCSSSSFFSFFLTNLEIESFQLFILVHAFHHLQTCDTLRWTSSILGSKSRYMFDLLWLSILNASVGENPKVGTFPKYGAEDKAIGEAHPVFWECPPPFGFHHHQKAWCECYHELKYKCIIGPRSWMFLLA